MRLIWLEMSHCQVDKWMRSWFFLTQGSHLFLFPQVTEETAQVVQSLGYSVTRRGVVQVKGKGELTTYFINTEHSSSQFWSDTDSEFNVITQTWGAAQLCQWWWGTGAGWMNTVLTWKKILNTVFSISVSVCTDSSLKERKKKETEMKEHGPSIICICLFVSRMRH